MKKSELTRMEIRLNQAQKQQKTSQEQIVEAQKATEVTNFNFIEFFNRIFFWGN